MKRRHTTPSYYARNAAMQAQRRFLRTGKTEAERLDDHREATANVLVLCILAAIYDKYGIGEMRLQRVVDCANEFSAKYALDKQVRGEEQAKAALLAGKHVLCEKPIVPTLAQLDELLGLAEERHLHLLEAITTIDHPNYGLAKLFAKEIGDIKTVSCTFCQYSSRYDAFMNGQTPPVFDPAYCGGALMDLNIYNIYFVVGLFGDPKAVHYYPNRHANGIDTSGILILEYPDFVCQCTAAKDSSARNSVQIIGSDGNVLIEPGSNNCQKLVVTRKGKEPYISEISDTPWRYEVIGISNFLIVPQDAVKERRIRAMRSAVAVLEAARKDAHLDF